MADWGGSPIVDRGRKQPLWGWGKWSGPGKSKLSYPHSRHPLCNAEVEKIKDNLGKV